MPLRGPLFYLFFAATFRRLSMTFRMSQSVLALGFPTRVTTGAMRFSWWLVILLAMAGCRLIDREESSVGHSPLRHAQPSPDSVTLELYWVRFAYGDSTLNEDAWQEIDEGKLPASLRRELANNGFRAGIVGSTLPDALATAMQLDTAQAEVEPDGEQSEQDYTVDLMAEPTVRRRLLQLQCDRRAEVQASDVYPSLPLLVRTAGELAGRTYHDAQAMYALKVESRPEGRVDVELIPELHHGPPKIRYDVSDGGVLRHTQRRNAEVYSNLRIKVPLAAGEMLVLMSLPDSKTNLGHYFHTAEDANGRQQKLILIRLADVPPSDTFAYVP